MLYIRKVCKINLCRHRLLFDMYEHICVNTYRSISTGVSAWISYFNFTIYIKLNSSKLAYGNNNNSIAFNISIIVVAK